MAAERPLDKNKDCCFLTRGQVRKKQEDVRTREVKMKERVNDRDKA